MSYKKTNQIIMKTNLFQSTFSSKMLFACLLALPLYFSACKKPDSGDPGGNSVDGPEAGIIMAQVVDPLNGGLILQTEFAAHVALTNNNSIYCSVKKDSTVTFQSFGINQSYDYSLNWSRTMNCAGAHMSYENTFTGTGGYGGPNLPVSASGTVTGSYTVKGLDPSLPELSIDQDYTYKGTQTYNNSPRAIASTVTVHSQGIKVNKTNGQIIAGGIVSVSITGNLSTGEKFNYDATLTFHGGGAATLKVQDGTELTIQW